MTARVITLKSSTAGACHVEALPSYYLESGEPRGRWLGIGADRLGVAGDIVDQDFLAVMAGEDPRRPGAPLGRRFGESSARGFNVTCSAPKSVSVLFALGEPDTRRQVTEAHDAAVTAVAGWIERTALTRHRIDGQVAVVDADGIIAATFRQHTSRALDPQLHTHLVVANRVLAHDGRWLALDDLLAAFSTRTDAIRRRLDTKIDRFEDTMGRAPTPRERWQLERDAVLDSRPAKATAASGRQLHTEWSERAATLGHDPSTVVATACGLEVGYRLDPAVGTDLVADAVAALEEMQSTWRPDELTREVARISSPPTSAPRRTNYWTRSSGSRPRPSPVTASTCPSPRSQLHLSDGTDVR